MTAPQVEAALAVPPSLRPATRSTAAGPTRAVAADDAYPLTMRGVTKRWQKDGAPVLDGLDLTLEPGSVTWIGGRNGAGKTTLLRIAAGLIEAEAGEVAVWGLGARRHRGRYQRLVSFLPAGDRGLYARLTVRHQLDFTARIAFVPSAQVQETVARSIERFDLTELVGRRVDRLSMGQRQRLRIAMTFMSDPEIVLLDEPLTSLDGDGAGLLRGAIGELLEAEGAVLWCSPNGEHQDMRFDARLLLDGGRLEAA